MDCTESLKSLLNGLCSAYISGVRLSGLNLVAWADTAHLWKGLAKRHANTFQQAEISQFHSTSTYKHLTNSPAKEFSKQHWSQEDLDQF
jgi:hypothetical protein